MTLPIPSDPISGIVLEKASNWMIGQFLKYEADHRLRAFLKALLEELNQTERFEDSNVDAKLRTLLSTENRRDAMMSAYRKVSQSATRTLGPRIIGLLTGRLILEDRIASPIEDQFFLCAEQLNDVDLIDFKKIFLKFARRDFIKQSRHPYNIELFEVRHTLDWGRNDPSIADAALSLGKSIYKLKSLGIVTDDVEFKTHQRPKRSKNEEPEFISERTYKLFCSTEFLGLVELIERAQGPDNEAPK